MYNMYVYIFQPIHALDGRLLCQWWTAYMYFQVDCNQTKLILRLLASSLRTLQC